jgi:NTP pyrophosphatase (non-canonical NTP hydrolase)
MSDLTFDEYQKDALTTDKYTQAAHTLLGENATPDALLLLRIFYVGNGLGEAGEIQNKIKKILRDDNGILTVERREQILDEVGGLLWYLVNLCHLLDAQLSDVALINLAILKQRNLEGTIFGDGDKR